MPHSTSSVSNSSKSATEAKKRLNITVAPQIPRVARLETISSSYEADRADLLATALAQVENLVDPGLLDTGNISENDQGFNEMGKLNSVARNINDLTSEKRSFKRETSVTELFKKQCENWQNIITAQHQEMPKPHLKGSSSSNNGFSPLNTERYGKVDNFTRKMEMVDATPVFNHSQLSDSGTPRNNPD